MKARRIVGAALAAFAVSTAAAPAQDWPTRPPTVVVPFAAGGPIDVVARILSPRMTELLGQQVIVDNIPGAGGMVGASRVGKAASDGYRSCSATRAPTRSASSSTRSRCTIR